MSAITKISKALNIKSFVLYPSPFKLLRCWLRSLTPNHLLLVGIRSPFIPPPAHTFNGNGIYLGLTLFGTTK
ncbi:MAG: hypothetical protein QS721_07670 [Candidatus Endonucleobacter sp. (ex Gigantidas childressi)]|nr:hypothetical protein [Candidatus Endonucleobacter sp. (ex Gigantidas childressi)]